jgi:AcrR family transcriptional regulator
MPITPTQPRPRAKPKQRHSAADRRVQVVAAARQLFATHGPEGTAVRAIAAEAGVSPAALYLYFSDKHALMAAVCDSIFADLIAMFADQADGGARADPFARLSGFMQAYVRWGLAHPSEYRLLFMIREMHQPNASSHRGPPVPGGPQLGPELFAMLVREVEALMAAGHFRRGDATTTAEAIWAAGHGVIALLTTLPAFPFTPPDQLTRYMTDVIIRGLAAG